MRAEMAGWFLIGFFGAGPAGVVVFWFLVQCWGAYRGWGDWAGFWVQHGGG